MTKIRKPKGYNLSKSRFMEVYYHCLQYNEWKDELQAKTDTVGAMEITDMPKVQGAAVSQTERLAIRRAELSKKIKTIEETATEVAPDLEQYIIKAVTNDWVTYRYLSSIMNIPCSRNTYYKHRRKFYYLISEKIK